METISFGGRSFSLGAPPSKTTTSQATPVVAAVMVGATVGLLAHVLKASTGVAILTGVGATVLTKIGIDRVSA